MFIRGSEWFTSYLGSSPTAFLFFGVFNLLGWGCIYLAASTYENPRSSWFPAVFGFSLPLYAHPQLDLASDAQAAIGLVIIPIYSIPLTCIGGLIGKWVDRRSSKPAD